MQFTIEQARKYAGLTQAELAKKLGVSIDIYRRIISSPETTTVAQAKTISKETGISIDNIIFLASGSTLSIVKDNT